MWDDPEVELVAHDIVRVPVPLPHDGLKAVNVYVLADGDGVTLIDSGWDGPVARAAVERGLAELGAEVPDIRRMLITHMHYDHLGQADALVTDGAGEYWLGEDERQSFTNLVTDPVASRNVRLDLLEGLGAKELAEQARGRPGIPAEPLDWRPPAQWMTDGQTAPVNGNALRAIATPGHTRGHLCFVDEDRRLLFAGDHILPHITPSLGLEPHSNPMALADFLASLARVRDLEVDLVLPAHGPVFPDLAGRVDALVDHHDDRLAACAAALSPDGSSPFTVATRIGWTRRQTDFADLDRFNQTLAVWESAAHLLLLTARGEVSRTTVDGVQVFAPSDADQSS